LDKYYSSLYSGTHLAGGYLRYNGSYLKELPIAYPNNEEVLNFFEKLANYLLFLTHVQFYSEVFYEKFNLEIETIKSYFNSLANELVECLYLKSNDLLKMIKKRKQSLTKVSFDEWLIKITDLDANHSNLLTENIYQEIKLSYLDLQKIK
jgi:hypothetical protein